HAIPLAAGLDVIGHAPDAEEVVGLEDGEAVLAAQALARAHLVPDGLEPDIAETHGQQSRPTGRSAQGKPGRSAARLGLHGAGGEPGDVVLDEEGVDQRHGDGAEEGGGHELAPVEDVAADQFGYRTQPPRSYLA